ncbi:MAG TPA: hypothetical protein VKS20_11970 [Candidatus Acidoferrales bacterium]|nr:hypothetical protein [Candidatus Acidoferrales bacterium]
MPAKTKGEVHRARVRITGATWRPRFCRSEKAGGSAAVMAVMPVLPFIERKGTVLFPERFRCQLCRWNNYFAGQTLVAFFLWKRALGVLPNAREFLAEHSVQVFENQSSDFLDFIKEVRQNHTVGPKLEPTA